MLRFLWKGIEKIRLKIIIKYRIFKFRSQKNIRNLFIYLKKSFLVLTNLYKRSSRKSDIYNKLNEKSKKDFHLKSLQVVIMFGFYIIIIFLCLFNFDLAILNVFEEFYNQLYLIINNIIFEKISSLTLLYNYLMKLYNFWMDGFEIINFFNIYVPETLKDPGIMNFFQSRENIEYGNSFRVGLFSFELYLKFLRGSLEGDILYKIRGFSKKFSNLSRFLKIHTQDIFGKEKKVSFDKKILFLFQKTLIRLPYIIKKILKRLNKFLYHDIICNIDFSYVKNLQYIYLFTLAFILNGLICLQYIMDFIFYIFQDLYIYLLYINKLQFDLLFDFYLYVKQYILYNIYYFFNIIFFDNNIFILLQSFIAYIFEYNKYIIIIFKSFIIDLFNNNNNNNFNLIQVFKNQMFIRSNLILEYYQELDFKRKLKLWLKLPKNYKIVHFRSKYTKVDAILGNAFYPDMVLDKFPERKNIKFFESLLFFDKSKIKFLVDGEPILNTNSVIARIIKKIYEYLLFIFNFSISLFVLGFFGLANFKKDINYIYIEATFNVMNLFTIRKNDLSDYISQYWEIIIAKLNFEEIYDDDDFDKDLDGRIPTFELTVSDNLLAFEKYYSAKIYDIESNKNNYYIYRFIELKTETLNKNSVFLNNVELQAYGLSKVRIYILDNINFKGYMFYFFYIFRMFTQKLKIDNKYLKMIISYINVIKNYHLTKNYVLLNYNFTTLINKTILFDLKTNENFNYLVLMLKRFNNRRNAHATQIPFLAANVEKNQAEVLNLLEKDLFKGAYNNPNYKNINEQLYNLNNGYKNNIKDKTTNFYIEDFKYRHISSKGNFGFSLSRIIIYILILSCAYTVSNGFIDFDFLFNIKQTISALFYYIFSPMEIVVRTMSYIIHIIVTFLGGLRDLVDLYSTLGPNFSKDFSEFSVLTYHNLVGLWDSETTAINQILLSLKIYKFYELLSDQLDFDFELSEGIETTFIKELIDIQVLKLYLHDIKNVKNKNFSFMITKIPIIIYLYYKKLLIALMKQLYLSFRESISFLNLFDMGYYIKNAKMEMKTTVFSKNKNGKKFVFQIEYLIRNKFNLFKKENSFLNGFIYRNRNTGNDTENKKQEALFNEGYNLNEEIIKIYPNSTSNTFEEFTTTFVNKLNKSIKKLGIAFKVGSKKTNIERFTNEKKVEERQEFENLFNGQTQNVFKGKDRAKHYRLQEFLLRLQLTKKNPTLRIWDYRSINNKTDKFLRTLFNYLQEVLGRMSFKHHRKFYNVYEGKKMHHEMEKKYKDFFDKIYHDKYKTGSDVMAKLREYRFDNRKGSNFVFSNKYFYDFKLRRLKDFEGGFINKLFFRFLRYRKDFILRMEEHHPVEVFNAFFEKKGLFGKFSKGGPDYRDKIISVARDTYKTKGVRKRYLRFIERRAHISRVLVLKKVKKIILRTFVGRQSFRKDINNITKKNGGDRLRFIRAGRKEKYFETQEKAQKRYLVLIKQFWEKLKKRMKT